MCGGFSGMCCGFCWTGVGFRTQSWCRQQAHRGAALTGTGKAQGDVSGGRRRTRIQGWQRPLPELAPPLSQLPFSPFSLCSPLPARPLRSQREGAHGRLCRLWAVCSQRVCFLQQPPGRAGTEGGAGGDGEGLEPRVPGSAAGAENKGHRQEPEPEAAG